MGIGSLPRNFVIAALLAFLLHVALLTTTISLPKKHVLSHKTLHVSLTPKLDLPFEAPPEEIENSQLPSNKPTTLPEDILIATPTQLTNVPPAKIKVQTSLGHRSIAKFIEQETVRYRQENPGTVGQFSKTFEPENTSNYNVISTDSVNDRAEIRGIGVYSTQNKAGNRTCYAEIFDLLDPAAGSSIVGKDCTPKKKFDLKMNKPNNG